MLATVGQKGQVTIPAPIRRMLGIRPGDRVAFVVHKGEVRLTAASSVVELTAGKLRGGPSMLSPAEEKAAGEDAWAESGQGS